MENPMVHKTLFCLIAVTAITVATIPTDAFARDGWGGHYGGWHGGWGYGYGRYGYGYGRYVYDRNGWAVGGYPAGLVLDYYDYSNSRSSPPPVYYGPPPTPFYDWPPAPFYVAPTFESNSPVQQCWIATDQDRRFGYYGRC
jgi:hypothetical protein